MITSHHTETALTTRPWLSSGAQRRELEILTSLASLGRDDIDRRLHVLIERNRAVHENECINLNPASNVMNPRAEAALASGLASRASLGHAGEKYEMGLEAIEEIEVIAADLVCQVFEAQFAEIRVGSGALANLYAFMATCQPGDAIIVPPTSIGGHVTHRSEGAAGLYGLAIHECPADRDTHSFDLQELRSLAARVGPKLITIGTSLNLAPHPVAAIREIADEHGAHVLFDAAHACGMIAGRHWPNPLDLGAHIMTMSTYKSLGGPAGGLVVTNDLDLAGRIDAIAYPGLTANFDVGKTAALAITMLDWLEYGSSYAAAMVSTAARLARELEALGLPVHRGSFGPTTSHQFALDAREWGGGHTAALRLRDANLLTSAIGLPGLEGMGGLRLGTPEVVRWGMCDDDMPELAQLLVQGLRADPADAAPAVTAFRRRFAEVQFVR